MRASTITMIVRCDDQTMRNWFKRWTAQGVEGLKDRPMPERPAKVTKTYKEQVLLAVRRRPRALGQPYSMWTYQRLADYMAQQTGLRVSYETVRRVLVAQGLVLSRPHHKVSRAALFCVPPLRHTEMDYLAVLGIVSMGKALEESLSLGTDP